MPVQSRPIKHTMPESDKQVQREVEERMGTRPCIWQIKVVRKVLEGGDVITITATGSGKSFTYWMVLLYIKHGIVVLVTPLKLLGKQFVDVLAKNDLKGLLYILYMWHIPIYTSQTRQWMCCAASEHIRRQMYFQEFCTTAKHAPTATASFGSRCSKLKEK